MTTYDDSYSRFIAWTKIVLPIIALGILSTLFLFSRNIDTSQSIPYADVDVDELAREQRIGSPNYAGVTEDGAAISVTAKSARPSLDDAQRALATDLVAVIEDAAGGRIELVSREGVIDGGLKQVLLSGGVHMQTSTGFTIETSGVTAALDQSLLVTDGEISAKGPLGTLHAGRMELHSQEGVRTGHLLVFKGGVKLIYDPKGE